MPVGTNATVKGLSPEEVYNLSSGIILANTYHLMISPGADIIRLHGGCKKMMRWENSLLTDSGGFQVFSLAKKMISQMLGLNLQILKTAISIF